MSKWGKFEFDDLKKFAKQLEQIREEREQLCIEVEKALAARLLAKVIPRTPTGNYPPGSGKVGGTLKRSWQVTDIIKKGDIYEISIFNPVEYAPYVEYGHRQEVGRFVPAIGKRLKNAWVPGRFMLTISEQELQRDAARIIDRKVTEFLMKRLGG